MNQAPTNYNSPSPCPLPSRAREREMDSLLRGNDIREAGMT